MIRAIRYYALISALIVTALILVLPKTVGLFWGVVIAYIGFAFLNLFPFLYKFRIPRIGYYIFSTGCIGCIGYGWATVIHYSNGYTSGIVTFLGAVLIIIGLIGFVIAIIEMIKYAQYDGLVTESLYTDGIFRLVRHPHTFSAFLLLLGFILYFWSTALALSAPLWTVGLISYAALEEKFDLVLRFGEKYLEYCGNTPGLVPNRSSIKSFLTHFNV